MKPVTICLLLSAVALVLPAQSSASASLGNSPNTTVFIGDSITAFGNATASTQSETYGWGWTAQAVFLSNGRIQQLLNAGVPGQTSGQIESRFASDVVANNPGTVVIMAGTNDATTGTLSAAALASTVNNLKAMIDQAKAAGIQSIICTIPPRGDGTTYNQNVQKINAAIHQLAQSEKVMLVDLYSVLVDPTTGSYRSGYSLPDGIHPSAAGAKAMAQFFITATENLFGPAQISLVESNADSTNLIPNPLFLTSISNWTSKGYGTSPAATYSVVTDPSISGNWLSFSFAPSTAPGQYYSVNGPAVNTIAGHHMAYSFKFQVSGLQENGGSLNMGYAYGASNFTYGYLADTAGTFYIEFTASGNSFVPGFVAYPTVSSSKIQLKIAQISLVDLSGIGY